MTALIDAALPATHAEKIRRMWPNIELVYGLSAAALQQAEVVYTSKAAFDPAEAKNLRWVQLNVASTTHLAGTPIALSGIPVANVKGAYSPAVAEFAIAMLLSMTRRLPLIQSLQQTSTWLDDVTPLQGWNCYGKTMGIVGYGSIGRHCARMAQAMGMRVLASKRRPELRRDDGFCFAGLGDPEGSIPEAWYGIDAIAEMLRVSDVAMVTLPETPATRGLIGKPELEALPAHAYLVNVGRGPVIDEPALLEHLRAGRLAGAAIDVFNTEPLPADSPFWKLPNVIVAPHVASWTVEQGAVAAEVFIENLSRYFAGRPLLNVVNMQEGY